MADDVVGESLHSATSPFAEQHYSLPQPKAGGAHASLNESLTYNLTRGAASLTIPIAVTPTRRRLEPRLHLRYDSDAGNGPFGIGWTLQLPGIVRQTSRGVPLYEESDTFILQTDGQPVELVPTSVQSTSVVAGRQYRVRRFEPLILTIPIKLEQWSNDLDPNDVHWRHSSADNVATIFGLDSASRVVDPVSGAAFSWLASYICDCYGNAIKFSYRSEDIVGADAESVQPSPTKYIEKMEYGNRKPFSQDDLNVPFDFHFEVFFLYSSSSPSEAARLLNANGDPNASWAHRQDGFSTCRSGFRIQTLRLCRNILLLHHFDKEAATKEAHGDLVRSYTMSYLDHPCGTQMGSFRETGYSGRKTKSKPLAVFTYNTTELDLNATLQSVNLGSFLSCEQLEWIDMDGTGLPDLVVQNKAGTFVRTNISTTCDAPSFTDWMTMSDWPTLQDAKLSDFDNDGHVEYVDWKWGFYKKRGSKWEPFKPFQQVPNQDLKSTHARVIDLTGDGTGDLLVSDKETYLWYQMLRNKGFVGPKAARFEDQEPLSLPGLQPTQPKESLYVADMTGDGLLDLVRIRNGCVSYWPNIGHGRFEEQVTMHNSPHFEDNRSFSHSRVFLHDLDGSGTADVVYLPSTGGLHVYMNESGNSWSARADYAGFPRCRQNDTPRLVDLYGTGTKCIVLCDQVAGNAHVLNMFGSQKPRMLATFGNGLGLTTQFLYTSSSQLQRRDLLAGNPWILTLPFPIQCLTQVIAHDSIIDSKTERHFQYRDGYYDDVRREFNGFGVVEEWLGSKDAYTTLHTRTAYFTGSIEQYHQLLLAKETYSVPLLLQSQMSGITTREALRAAKGSLIRKDIAPATVSMDKGVLRSETHRYQIESYQDGDHKDSFRVNPIQTTTLVFELGQTPRIHQYQAFEIDRFGNALSFADIYYGMEDAPYKRQNESKVLLTERQLTKVLDVEEGFRAPAEYERRQSGGFAILKYDPNRNILRSFLEQQVEDLVLMSIATLTFRFDDLTDTLPLGHAGLLGLVAFESSLSFDANDVQGLAKGFGASIENDMKESGYTKGKDGNWYANSGQWYFGQHSTNSQQSQAELVAAKASFFTPTLHVDPFGNSQILYYDDYWLCRIRLQLPLGVETLASYDYHQMTMSVFTDETGIKWSYEYDALGNVLRRFKGEYAPGTLSVDEEDVIGSATGIEQNAQALLQSGVAFSFYDYESRPCKVVQIAKLKRAPSIKISYLDGNGQPCQERSLVGPSKWLVTSSKVLAFLRHDYEPFYAATLEFGLPPTGNNLTTTIFDSLQRPAMDIRQDGAWSWVEYGAWSRTERHFGGTSTLKPPTQFEPALVESSRILMPTEEEETIMYWNTRQIMQLDSEGQDIQVDSYASHDVPISSRTLRSVDGRITQVFNSKDQCVLLSKHNKSGHAYYTNSMDAGEQYCLQSTDEHITRLLTGNARNTNYHFDKLRRPTVNIQNGVVAVSRTYYEDRLQPNAFNRVRTIENSSVTITFLEYDVRGNPGRIEHQVHTPKAVALPSELPMFTLRKEYDLDGKILWTSYPNGTELFREFDSIGRLVSVKNHASIEYTSSGHVDKVDYKNGCETIFQYGSTNWLERKVSKSKNGHIQECMMKRDVMGRIVELSDDAVDIFKANKGPLSWTYSYDGHGRLLSGTTHTLTDGNPCAAVTVDAQKNMPALDLLETTEHYTYDSESNIIHQDLSRTESSTQFEYLYDSSSNKLRAISKDGHNFQTALYKAPDAALGLPSQVNQLKLEWDHEQRLSRTYGDDPKTETHYTYDTLGMRISKLSSLAGRKIISVYLEDFESTYVFENAALTKDDDTVFVRNGDTLLAQWNSKSGISNIITDHLSSIALELDAEGNAKRYRSYAPYGEMALDLRIDNGPHSAVLSEGFTGKKHDDETDFDYSKNRYLATQMKRWLSPDPSGLLGGSNNLYCYADADPINKIDHDGLIPLNATDGPTGEKYGVIPVLATVLQGALLGGVAYYGPKVMQTLGTSKNIYVKAAGVLGTTAFMKTVDYSIQQTHQYFDVPYHSTGSDVVGLHGVWKSVLQGGPVSNLDVGLQGGQMLYNMAQKPELGATKGYGSKEGLKIKAVKDQNDPYANAALDRMHDGGNFFNTTTINNPETYGPYKAKNFEPTTSKSSMTDAYINMKI